MSELSGREIGCWSRSMHQKTCFFWLLQDWKYTPSSSSKDNFKTLRTEFIIPSWYSLTSNQSRDVFKLSESNYKMLYSGYLETWEVLLSTFKLQSRIRDDLNQFPITKDNHRVWWSNPTYVGPIWGKKGFLKCPVIILRVK